MSKSLLSGWRFLPVSKPIPRMSQKASNLSMCSDKFTINITVCLGTISDPRLPGMSFEAGAES